MAEVVVPVGAVDAVAAVEEHVIGDVGEVVVGAKLFGAAFHGLISGFIPNVESAFGGGEPTA